MARFAPWETSPHLAVAVSGGADSMALALMAQRWAGLRGGHITALMVDHGLRTAAQVELNLATTQLLPLGVACHRIALNLAPGSTQESAREQRYAAMAQWCQIHEVLHLLVGHHRDDQAETLMLRLAAGSGPAGLASMSAQTYRPGVRLLRPLLSLPKSWLVSYLQNAGVTWSEDPSNHSFAYARTRARAVLHTTSPSQRDRLSCCTDTLGLLRRQQEALCNTLLARHAVVWPEGAGFLDQQALAHPYAEDMLARLFSTIGSLPFPPRSKKLRHACAALGAGKTISLHGCVAQPMQYQRRHGIFFYREYHAVATLETRLGAHHTSALWDRFAFTINGGIKTEGLRIAALGVLGFSHIKPLVQPPAWLPYRACLALPALWHLEKCLYAPHIMPVAPANIAALTPKFIPAKSLGKSPFFAMNEKFI